MMKAAWYMTKRGKRPPNFRHTLRTPAIIVIRIADAVLEEEGQRLHQTITGIFQSIMLVALTILFGSMFPMRMLQTAIFITAFILAVAFSRGISVWYAWKMQQLTNLTIIECSDAVDRKSVV